MSVDDAITSEAPPGTEMPGITLFQVPPDVGRFALGEPPVA